MVVYKQIKVCHLIPVWEILMAVVRSVEVLGNW